MFLSLHQTKDMTVTTDTAGGEGKGYTENDSGKYVVDDTIDQSMKTSSTLTSNLPSSTAKHSVHSSKIVTKSLNDFDKYLCRSTDTKCNVMATSVPVQLTERIFITSTVNNQEEENQELEGEKRYPTYAMDHVPIFDEFAFSLDDKEDYE